LFVHLIVVPTETVMGLGTYAVVDRNVAPLGMLTTDAPGPGVGVGVGEEGALGAG
jgi:hypothetical protein